VILYVPLNDARRELVMDFIPYSEIDKSKWDQLVLGSPDGWLYQTTKFIDWFGGQWTHYENRSFAISSETGEYFAVCPLYFHLLTLYPKPLVRPLRVVNYALYRLLRRRLLLLQVLDTWYSGPVFAYSLKDKGRKKYWKILFEHIDDIAHKTGADLLEVRLTDVALAQLPPLRCDSNPLLSVGVYDPAAIPPRLFVALDLGKSEEKLLMDMDVDCRSEIRQGEKKGVTARIGTAQDLPLYHSIHVSSSERTGVGPQSIEHFQSMFEALDGDKHVKFIFAEYSGKPVAGIILHTFKESVYYWAGCSLKEAHALKANNLLLFSAIRWAKQQNFRWFGVGLFDAFRGPNEKGYAVGQFKAQFASTYYTAFEGRKYYSAKAASYATKQRKAVIESQNRHWSQKAQT
jgi:hypothetical protein